MARKNALKRVLMYFVVMVGMLFVGFMAFYFAKNDEVIALTIPEGSIVHLNKGEVIALPLLHEDPHRSTTFEAAYSTEGIVTVSFDLKTITANTGGATTITITPSNKAFGPFRFDVLVGDGTSDNPWYVSSAAQLASIGKTPTGDNPAWTIYHSYELISDINLNTTYKENQFWQPISEFHGTILGEGHTISNLKVVGNSTNMGMFGTLSQTARIENINFTNTHIEANGSTYVGTIAGINKGFIGKVSINGTLISTGATSVVGGVVGYNNYDETRPTLNMVSANLNITALGTVGGLAGENRGGIIFNSSSVITSLDVYVAPQEQNQSEQQSKPLSSVVDDDELEPVPEPEPEPEPLLSISFGGVVSKNTALVYGAQEDFRQAAIKNVFVKINADKLFERNQAYANSLALVVHTNHEISSHIHTYAVPNVYTAIYAIEYRELKKFVLANNAIDSDIKIVNGAQAANSETYNLGANWAFDINTQTPIIKFSSSFQPTLVSDPGNKISTAIEVVTAFRTIIQNNSKAINFTIDASNAPNKELVVDAEDIMEALNITAWRPIGDTTNPYKGQLIVEGGTLVIENLTVNSPTAAYLGFFGYVSGANTVIKNIALKNVTLIESERTAFAGGLAAYVDSGYIENVWVDNVTIKNASTAGFVVGYNKGGTLNNIQVGSKFEEEHVNLISYDLNGTETIYQGGIAGISGGVIKNAVAQNATLENKKEIDINAGGLVGKLLDNSSVESSSNQGVYINSYSPKGYYGGLVGYMNAKSTIDYSFNLGDILAIAGEAEDSFAGGIAGYVGENALIKSSFSHTLSIKAKNVGGIVATNYGSVRECYSLGDYIGRNVGGLAYYNKGEMRHVFTRATVKSIGRSKDDSAAGLVVIIPKGGKIEFAYSSASIQAPNGAIKFAETRSYIRYTGVEKMIDGWFGGIAPGTIKNYIVINYGDAVVQSDNFNALFRGIGWAGLPKDFIQTDEDAVLGYGAENPFAKAGFDPYTPQYWIFEDGQWPTLTSVVPNPLLETQ